MKKLFAKFANAAAKEIIDRIVLMKSSKRRSCLQRALANHTNRVAPGTMIERKPIPALHPRFAPNSRRLGMFR